MHIDLPDVARMKVHLRVMTLAGRTYRVVTLRPSARVSYSTNHYHDTWHVVSDTAGAQILARLMWGLAYQKQAGTLVMIAEPHLVPTPFDGAKSDPVVIVPAGLTPVCEDALRELKRRLGRLGSPTQTVRWQTFGLDRELAQRNADVDTKLLVASSRRWSSEPSQVWRAEQMSRVGGFICYTAPAFALRYEAAMVAQMQTTPQGYSQMAYHYLAEVPWARQFADGEVQIFHDYRERVSAARVARREVLACEDAPRDAEQLETVVSARRDAILRRRRRSRS